MLGLQVWRGRLISPITASPKTSMTLRSASCKRFRHKIGVLGHGNGGL